MSLEYKTLGVCLCFGLLRILWMATHCVIPPLVGNAGGVMGAPTAQLRIPRWGVNRFKAVVWPR
jgi:hypothetical protein